MEKSRGYREISIDDVIIPSDIIRKNPGISKNFISLTKHKGIQNPIGVRPRDDKFELVWGHRRLLGAKAANLQTVPCVIVDFNDEETIEMRLIENYMRTDPSPMDVARYMDKMILVYGRTEEEVGALLDKSKSWVSNHLRVFREPVLRDLVDSKLVTFSAALEFLTSRPDPNEQSAEYEAWKKSFGAKTNNPTAPKTSKGIRRANRTKKLLQQKQLAQSRASPSVDATMSQPMVVDPSKDLQLFRAEGVTRVFLGLQSNLTIRGNVREDIVLMQAFAQIIEAFSSGKRIEIRVLEPETKENAIASQYVLVE